MYTRLDAILVIIVSTSAALATTSHRDHARTHSLVEHEKRVSINDNRAAAGILRRNELTLHLVAQVAMWYPDGDSVPGTPVQAFGEEGRAPLIPGPMIRVRAGTKVSLSLRNDVPNTTLTVHGLTSRSAMTTIESDSVQIASGGTRTLHIRFDVPGTYYYWGTTMGRPLDERFREDAQLSGAIIVDPAYGPVIEDRVLMIGMWADTSGRAFLVRKRMLVVINGRSWPQTERLSYAVGDSIHWHVINTSADSHPMHLHGFYFRVDSRGNGVEDSAYAGTARDQVVTELMKPGATMSMTWSPDRAGNWLFHCHLPVHFAHRGSLGTPPTMKYSRATMNHALEGMSGLVMGVTVRAKAGAATPVSSETSARRQMRLVIRSNANGSATAPSFGFVLEDGQSRDSVVNGRATPPIVLVRGQQVSITVVNTLTEPTAIHWHGIELESYYDGVAGFSGTAQRLSPVIAPGDSFTARFAPPRRGTFIYHTHIDEERQQPAGLAGAIIVLAPGERFDPVRDLVVVASSQRIPPDSTGVIPRVAWLNGAADGNSFDLRVGVSYRVRFINMTTGNPGLRFELTQDGKRARWRPLAKDGADLPVERQILHAASQAVSIGETADVEFVPDRPGDQRLDALLANGTIAGTIMLHVTRPDSGKTNPTRPLRLPGRQ